MWLLRVLAVVLIIAVGTGLLAYAATGNRKYLGFAWRTFRYGVYFALGVFALMFLERVAVIA